jgi:hypothetical protein
LIESRKDDDRMLHMAHASRFAWAEAPECRPYEALARASALARDAAGAASWRERARTAGDAIADPEDREPFERDFATL